MHRFVKIISKDTDSNGGEADEQKYMAYVVDTIEAAVWLFLTTDDFKACELKAVNLGDDADTIGAFGCGAFRNPPEVAADVFRQITAEYCKHFEAIEYAVFHTDRESENYKAFKRAFSK